MTNAELFQALGQTVGSKGWQEIILPEVQTRYDAAIEHILNTPTQTDANIHKAAGLASAYSFILKGIPEVLANLHTSLEEESATAPGLAETAPPIM